MGYIICSIFINFKDLMMLVLDNEVLDNEVLDSLI